MNAVNLATRPVYWIRLPIHLALRLPLRLKLLAILLVTLVVAPASRAPDTLSARLTDVAGRQAFDLTQWEVRTLSDRWSESIVHPIQPAGAPVVLEYARLTSENDRARQERDVAWARQAVTGSSPDLPASQQRFDALDAQVAQLRPVVEATVSAQVDAELRQQGLRGGLIAGYLRPFLPFVGLDVSPNVFFQLGPLPNLLVVAPRDEIRIVDSVLLDPSVSPAQIDRMESGADGLDVASVVTGIGGLAAYPTMLPDATSPRDLLITVSHEWTHHFLAFRPLGMRYFQSYQMTEINETVADMVGHEVGDIVYRSDYPPPPPARPAPPTATAPAAPAKPDYYTLMRQIRTSVEGYLARHDVAGAEAYMAQQRQALVQDGYYVRRLNTAYLAFFGSYAGSANPYELKLRLLRQKAGSLRTFLDTVSTIEQPGDLERLLAE
jgi:hypothetical protein